ncbi:MAG: cyclic nucleotide-binding/CBS domain-containing protein [Promethearchaeota archaeon]
MVSERQSHKLVFKDIASTNIHFCNEADTVSVIARKMRDFWIDAIFVKNDKGEVTGIITDGIIWNLIAKEKDPTDPRYLKAKNIMFKNFIRVQLDAPIESIEQLCELLKKTKIQRIGLVKDGRIVGIVREDLIERIKRYSRTFSFSLK